MLDNRRSEHVIPAVEYLKVKYNVVRGVECSFFSTFNAGFRFHSDEIRQWL